MVIKFSFHDAMSRVESTTSDGAYEARGDGIAMSPQAHRFRSTRWHTRQDVKTESGLTQPQVTTDVRTQPTGGSGLKRCPGSPPRGPRGKRKARRGLIRTAVRAHGRTHPHTHTQFLGRSGGYISFVWSALPVKI